MPKQGDEDEYILEELRQQRLISAGTKSGFFSKSPSMTPRVNPATVMKAKAASPSEPQGKSKCSGKQQARNLLL